MGDMRNTTAVRFAMGDKLSLLALSIVFSACGLVVPSGTSSTTGESGGGGSGGEGGSPTVTMVPPDTTVEPCTTTPCFSSGGGGDGGCGAATCGAKSCGVMADDCGNDVDCGSCGDVMTCDTENKCECTESVVTPDVVALCNDYDDARPSAYSWCFEHGGCDALKCGPSPLDDIDGSSAKHPESCVPSGYDVDLEGEVWFHVWCCARPCNEAGDCDDGNDCTVNACDSGACKFFDDGVGGPCGGGDGMCIDGTCVPSGQ